MFSRSAVFRAARTALLCLCASLLAYLIGSRPSGESHPVFRGVSGSPTAKLAAADVASADLRELGGNRSDSAPAPAGVVPVVDVARNESIGGRAVAATVSIRAGYSFGTGALVGDGLVLTALHVVAETPQIEVRFSDSRWLEARILDRAPDLDVALLSIDASRPAAPLGSVMSVGVGDALLSVGTPHQMGFTVSRGIAAYRGRTIRGLRYLQTDIPAEPGQSGGPVFDAAGRLVAMVMFSLRASDRIAFALPIDYALARFDERLAHLGGDARDAGFSVWAAELPPPGAHDAPIVIAPTSAVEATWIPLLEISEPPARRTRGEAVSSARFGEAPIQLPDE